LIVAVVLSAIGLTMYAALSNGIKIWTRVNQGIGAEDVDILFEKFESDARNCARISNIKFSGSEENVTFASLVPSAILKSSTVGTVNYSFDPGKSVISRSQRDVFDIYADRAGVIRCLLENVKSAKFSYYVYLKEEKKYGWQEEMKSQQIPLAIRMEIDVKCNDRTDRFTKTVSIPVADYD